MIKCENQEDQGSLTWKIIPGPVSDLDHPHVFKPWKGDLEGFAQPQVLGPYDHQGDQSLIYKSWDDPPSTNFTPSILASLWPRVHNYER